MVNDKRKERTDATQQMEYYFGGGYGDVPAARKGGCAVTTSSEDLRKGVGEF